MDILTFSQFGGYLEYYENQSADMGYGCDSLIYEFVDQCWGRMHENAISPVLELSPRLDSCPYYTDFWGQKNEVHVGSTVLTLDMDNDNDKEVILGDVSFNSINILYNSGNPDTCLLYTSPSPRDLSTSRMPSSA